MPKRAKEPMTTSEIASSTLGSCETISNTAKASSSSPTEKYTLACLPIIRDQERENSFIRTTPLFRGSGKIIC